ncbi:hypothetical protein F4778DRAFT_275133 [Xylariomycetidae sp. FL2044]|nr:hypothetical protein F4778DRAFT_275133 [Xylariomycetidae sp. FL2044]
MSPSADVSSNGTASQPASSVLEPGIYVPTVAFFTPEDTIDEKTTAQHAVHLDHAERSLVTKTTRQALDSAGYPHVPVIVGCGAQSTRETIQLCKEAAEAGCRHVVCHDQSATWLIIIRLIQ